MKSLDTKSKYFDVSTLISFALSLSRSLIAIALLIGALYGGALLLDSTFDFLFQVH